MRSLLVSAAMTLLAFLTVACANAESKSEVPDGLSLPPGYSLEVFASLGGPRQMAVAEDLGMVFVSTAGRQVWVIHDDDRDARPDALRPVLSGLNAPHGIAYKDGFLYVAERPRVLRYDLRGFDGKMPEPQVLAKGLPTSRHHGRRVLAIGPDDKLYLGIGTPCNICQPGPLTGRIFRLPLSGGRLEIFAQGIRNAGGLDFHPTSGVLHFTDNGADNMGDDSPPEEVNAAPEPGLHFGYPWYGGGEDRTPQFQDETIPVATTGPVQTLPAHNAPLGIHFYRGSAMPLTGDALVALHGSWNRTIPDGYRVVLVRFDEAGKALSWEPFLDGFLSTRGVSGRPAAITTLWDGSLLISDDYADRIYRVTYQGE